MTHAGHLYKIIHASPETGLEGFKHQLRTQSPGGVLIGGGLVGDPAMSYFLEQIIDAAHEVVPKAKIMFYNDSVDVQVIVERWFGARRYLGNTVSDSGRLACDFQLLGLIK